MREQGRGVELLDREIAEIGDLACSSALRVLPAPVTIVEDRRAVCRHSTIDCQSAKIEQLRHVDAVEHRARADHHVGRRDAAIAGERPRRRLPACALAANRRTALAKSCPSDCRPGHRPVCLDRRRRRRAAISLASVGEVGRRQTATYTSPSFSTTSNFCSRIVGVADIGAVREVEFLSMPRADDVHVVRS